MDTSTIIKTLLVDHGMTQQELSRLTGIPQCRLSRWAAGQLPASANDSLKLLEVMQEKSKRRKK